MQKDREEEPRRSFSYLANLIQDHIELFVEMAEDNFENNSIDNNKSSEEEISQNGDSESTPIVVSDSESECNERKINLIVVDEEDGVNGTSPLSTGRDDDHDTSLEIIDEINGRNTPGENNDHIDTEQNPEAEVEDSMKITRIRKSRIRNYRRNNQRETYSPSGQSSSENEELESGKKSLKQSRSRHRGRERKKYKNTDNNNIDSNDRISKSRGKIRKNHENSPSEKDGENHTEIDKPPKEKTVLQQIHEGIKQIRGFFDDSMCRKIEKKIDQIAEKAKCGLYKQKTYDKAPLRNKYFFGEGYTYGKQMEQKGPGQERLHKKGDVDEIPNWIKKHIIQKIYDKKIVPEGWINSAVINEYFPGGCIVSHIDPIHIFDRPILSISFNSKSFLSFGCKFSFNPIRTTEPVLALPLDRGCLTSIRYLM